MKRELGFQHLGHYSIITLLLTAVLIFWALPVHAQMLPSDPPADPPLQLRGQITQSDYIMGPGDALTIEDEVMGLQGQAVRILNDNSVNLKLVGKVYLGGLTLDQAHQVLNQAYSEYYVNPAITIQVVYQRPIRAYIVGAVQHPGMYETGKALLPEAPTLSQVATAGSQIYFRLTLLDLLIQAGGLLPNADVSDIHVVRKLPVEQVIHINLWDLFTGDVSQDFELRDKDVIEVTKIPIEQMVANKQWEELLRTNVAMNEFRVHVVGAVQKPDTFMVKNSDTVLNVISQAGGFTEVADRKQVYILRKNSQGQIFTQAVNLSDKNLLRKKPLDEIARLLPDDVVLVDNSKAKQFGKGALLFGRHAIDVATFTFLTQYIRESGN